MQVLNGGVHYIATSYLHSRSVDIIFLKTYSVKRKTGGAHVVVFIVDGGCATQKWIFVRLSGKHLLSIEIVRCYSVLKEVKIVFSVIRFPAADRFAPDNNPR